MKKDFLELLKHRRPILLDGAMGSELARKGLEPGARLNVSAPEEVAAVHRGYLEAGAQVIITNTFLGNGLYLAKSGEADKVREYNRAGAELARRTAGRDALVAGDIGPTGEFIEPYGSHTREEFSEAFSEQARALHEGGVDLFIVETMADPREITVAIEACRSAAPIPVVATMSFDHAGEEYRTNMGASPDDCAKAMASAGADAIGANCGTIDPTDICTILEQMRPAADLPLVAQPNAGKPELIEGEVLYRLAPDEFAEAFRGILDAGATVVGGCCGTGKEYIKALADLLAELRT